MFKIIVIQLVVLSIAVLLDVAQGHGMMLDPPGRSSRWRYDSSAPTNYNDNANYCGGYGVSYVYQLNTSAYIITSFYKLNHQYPEKNVNL